MSFIELKDIVKIYNEGKSNSVTALNGASLNIEKGESVAIMGVSGSGKSTLLHIIGCLDNLTKGSYSLDGIEIKKMGAAELAKIRSKKIGFILQSYGLIENERIYNNVKLPLLIGSKCSSREIKDKVFKALKSMGLADISKKKVRELSGGQKQRVAIARAIINDPDVILADEPTSALDSKTAGEIMKVFKRLNEQGKTIIIVTHDIKIAEQMGRVVYIEDGVIK